MRHRSHQTASSTLAVAGLLLGLAVAGCEGPGVEEVVDEGISRELARLRAATLSDVRYDFRLTVPPAADEPVTGELVLRFRRSDPDDRPVVLDFVEPGARIRGVTVDGDSVAPTFRADHAVFPADAFATGGEHEVRLRFEVGEGSLTRTDDFLYALFVPDRAHFALPVFDQPDLKGRFRLAMEVPGGWTATANGALVERATLDQAPGAREAHRTYFSFGETEPIPTSLFAFVTGDFRREEAERAGRHLTFHHRETDSARVARNLEPIFDLHGTALEWLEEYTGIDYPFRKFGFVAVPSFQYGGMEHPGAVYYRASGLFLDASATQGQLLGRASVIAHETAHMWFGDLVTMEWFDDVWMKEVFANFMAAEIVHPSFPELNHDLRFLVSHFPSAYAVDRTAGANPIRQELDNLNEAGTLYGAIIYQKAPIVMRQLERLVGEETFRDGLREYLDAHRYGNASWPDLIRVLDARSERDLEAWSRVWVGEAGRPTIRARIAEDEDGGIGGLEVVQEDPEGRGRRWPQSFHVVLGYGPDSTVALPVELLEERARVEGGAGMTRPDFVLPAGKGAGYGRVVLDQESRRWLLEKLPAVDDPLVRGAAWITLWDAVLDGDVAPADFLDLALRGVRTEETDLILERVLGYLRTTWWRLLAPEERRARASDVEETLWNGVAAAESTTRKASIFRAYRSVAVSPGAVERLRAVWAEEVEIPDLPLSERDYTALASELALRDVEGWSGILDRQAERITNPDRRDRFAFLRPSLSNDAAEREAFFERMRDEESREREPWVLDGLANLHHPLRAAHGRRFLEPGLELLPEVQRTGDIFFPKGWLDAILGGHASPEAAETVRDFLDAGPELPRRLRLKLLQSADMLFRAAGIVHGWEGGPGAAAGSGR